MIDLVAFRKEFSERYGRTPRIFSAPGRVNIIGEHTDYNEGFVLPIAIDRRTYVACAPRADRRIRAHSRNLEDAAEIDISDGPPPGKHSWVHYVFGMARTLMQQKVAVSGADLLIESEVPIGSGLSSSAALEVSAGKALLALAETEIDSVKLALAAQQAEHEFVGTKCGIMDQLTAATAKKGHALLIDCRSLEGRQIPLPNHETTFVVCNTNVKHELASSAYNQRRSECESAVAILQKYLPSVRALRDVELTEFLKFMAEMPEPVRRRARHVITENTRTLCAAESLARNDLVTLGRLMKASHESLRCDYEVSSTELDVMVDLASSQNSVFGARMTGGGFGGCTINVMRRDVVEKFRNFITPKYQEITRIVPEIYIVASDDGVREEFEN